MRWLAATTRLVALLAILFGGTNQTLSQETKSPLQPAQTSSPRATLFSFITTLNRAYRVGGGENPAGSEPLIDKAIRHLDLSEFSEREVEYRSEEAALKLKEVLDRIPIPDRADVPGRVEATGQSRETGIIQGGEASDATPPITIWQIPGSNIRIHQIAEGPREGEYLFTPRTVRLTSVWYKEIKDAPYKEGATPEIFAAYSTTPGRSINVRLNESLPAWSKWTIGGQTVWQWIALIITLVLLTVFIRTALKFGRKYDENLIKQKKEDTSRYWKPASVTALLVIVWVVSFVDHAIDDIINLTGNILLWAGFVLTLLGQVFVAWFVFVLISQLSELFVLSRSFMPKSAPAQLVRLVGYFIGSFAIVMIILRAAHQFGLPAYSIVTGFGVGGLAVSLAARGTLSDLLGSFVIMIERPYKLGDYVEINKFAGTVEEIGFRSTKLRTQSDLLISIPHTTAASGAIIKHSVIPVETPGGPDQK
jgi:MscS family membrane protein